MNILELTEMPKFISEDMNVSNKIRALNKAGYKRADIARFLNKRYQHVRNVLVQDAQVTKGNLPATDDNAANIDATLPRRCRAIISNEGRILIPAEFRDGMNVKAGEQVSLILEDGVLSIISPSTGIRKAQELVRKYIPENVSLVDELIKERRWEAAKEEQELRDGFPE